MRYIRKSEIPFHLQNGELYRTLVENNDDPFEELTFPCNVLKLDTSVKSVDDCDHLLGSVRFWGVDGFVSFELAEYALSIESSEVMDVLKTYESESKLARWVSLVVRAPLSTKLESAIQSEMVELVRAVNERYSLIPSEACDLAAEVGSVEILRYLLDQGYVWGKTTTLTAAKHGHVHVLKCFRNRGYGVYSTGFRAAIQAGHFECVEYLYSLAGDFLGEDYKSAICYGLDAVVRYHTASLCMLAAGNGHLHCLKFLHEHGASWDTVTCYEAAKGGHLHCLQYAREHGCPWNYQSMKYAVIQGHLDCLEYAHAYGCPLPSALLKIKPSNPCADFARQVGINVKLV